MAALLPCVEVGPRGQAAGAVVWLHGLGANGHDFEPIVPLLELPRVRFVFPHAPLRRVTINGGMEMPAWYDILALGGAGGSNPAHVLEARAQVDALLRREKERGIAPERTVLAGFSQGAAIALHAGIRYPETLAGILVLSGYEVLPHTREAEASPANRRTPMLFCHGTEDPLVPVVGGRAAFEAHAAERDAQWREFPIAHEVGDEEIGVVRDWLHARLMQPFSAAFNITEDQ
jgi:phospholipase/carboxylesterase